MRSTDYTAPFGSRRWVVIGAYRFGHCSIVPKSSCSLRGPPLDRFTFVVLFFNSVYPCLRKFNSTIPSDVVRVTTYVDSFLDPTFAPVRILINKLDLVPSPIVAGLVGVFRNSGGLGTAKSYIHPWSDLLLHRSPCFPRCSPCRIHKESWKPHHPV